LNERIQRLEEKIAYLERHVTEQDRAMLELVEQVGVLRRELKSLRERSLRGGSAHEHGVDDAAAERPPHY
jgi:SlyX protein